jgi:hypothetical protein
MATNADGSNVKLGITCDGPLWDSFPRPAALGSEIDFIWHPTEAALLAQVPGGYVPIIEGRRSCDSRNLWVTVSRGSTVSLFGLGCASSPDQGGALRMAYTVWPSDQLADGECPIGP